MTTDEVATEPPATGIGAVRPIESFDVPMVRGDMSWVTTDYGSPSPESATHEVAEAHSPTSRSIGDANLN